MKIESTLIFLNLSSPFSVLNGLCNGEVNFQAIITENKNGEMVLDCLEFMDIANVTFAGNKIDVTGYKEYQEWTEKVDDFFNCDIDQLITESAKAKINKKTLTKFASQIQIPNTFNKRNTECDGGCGCICCD